VEYRIWHRRMFRLVRLKDEQKPLGICRHKRTKTSDFLQGVMFIDIRKLERANEGCQPLGSESKVSRAYYADSLQRPLLDIRNLLEVSEERFWRFGDDV
jgi:hypothetical protein